MKRIVVSVINDLVTDQRVNRTCFLLHDMGYSILLVGRELPDSLPMNDRPYKVKRMKLMFTKGALFYAEYNIRLFLLLLFTKTDHLFSNDLDTLLPNFLISKIRGKKLYYDSHEYFTEVPELVDRPKVQNIWKKIEKFCLSRMERMITVNESIAKLFRDKYGINCGVVRNVPMVQGKQDLRIEKENVLILQGAGINIDRGGEELVEAMEFVEGYQLWIVGGGDALPTLKQIVKSKNLEEKVVFKGKVPLEQLREFTQKAQIGFTLDKSTNVNYLYSLPNKLFDYMSAGCAVIASNLPEVAKVVNENKCGLVIGEVTPNSVGDAINSLISDEDKLKEIQAFSRKGSALFTWEIEREKLLKYFVD